jgi:hypothetical protein
MKMKKIFGLLVAALVCCSCNDFLERNPENSIGSDAYFTSENDLELYTNSFINNLLSADEVVFGDQYTDVISTKSSTNFFKSGWNADQQGGWSWGTLRSINYMLDNMTKAKGNVSAAVYNHYEGVARFWRARFYYDKLAYFGGVPWYDHVLSNNDSIALYKKRDSRQVVMSKILEDLNFACENCLATSQFTKSSTRVSKYVALALKSRLCLYEGTYRKYHTELALDSADFYLRESIKASEELMKSNAYSLVDAASNKTTQYRSLFNTQDLKTQEVIFGMAYAADIRMHDVTWEMMSATAGNNWAMTRQFANMYLMRDGSRFTDKANYNSMEYKDEFTNRDCRMAQTIISPTYTKKNTAGAVNSYAPNFKVSYTGYQPIKWVIDDDAYIAKANSYNSLPIFRYAEILLNEAEAKAELGEMDETVWNKTIKLLRERAGVDGSVPTTYDPYLAEYYLNQTTDKWILEVRRERATEMAFESTRYEDLMRWKMGELMVNNYQGIYIPAKDKLMDLNGDGINDLYVSDTAYKGVKDGNAVYITVGSATDIIRMDATNHLVHGALQNRIWEDRMYLRPIPKSAILKNSYLEQNPGWGE